MVRLDTYHKAGNICQICGDNGISQGLNHAVECYEEWKYVYPNYRNSYLRPTQILKELVCLCPRCHEVKHIGLARVRGRGREAMEHFMFINNLSKHVSNIEIGLAFKVWNVRNNVQWDVSCGLIEKNLDLR